MAKQPGLDFQSAKGGLGELKRRLLFVIGALIVFRIGSFIPIPGIDAAVLAKLLEQQRGTIIEMFNMFSGGALSRASIFALGIMPYISASIIIQLLTVVHPTLAEIKKEGESGRRKISQYTRYGTLVLAIFQSIGIATGLPNMPGMQGLVINPGFAFYFTAVVSLVTGTMFLMWLGEQITERGIGNGISMILFAGIISRVPDMVINLIKQISVAPQNWFFVPLILVIYVLMIAFVILMTNAERRIPVQYAKRVVGRKMYGGQSSHLPIKVALGGVLPIIFASSILSIPSTINLFLKIPAGDGFWGAFFAAFSTSGWLYMVLYFLFIIMFAYFYTSIQYNPVEMANNLKANNGTVPGIRPGAPTADYIRKILSRITLIGAMFLAVIAMIPLIYGAASGMGQMSIGGTSIIIVVGVALETVKQLESQMMMRHYKGFLD